jgi:surface polysaccharide O-acyltransferase-like enzyme
MTSVGIGIGVKAILGVAWLGAPILVFVAGYASALARGFGERAIGDLLRRMRRLGAPYLAWTVVFWIAQNTLPFGKPASMTVAALLTGRGVYDILWFLAMLIWVSALAWLVRTTSWRLIAAALWLAVSVAHGVFGPIGVSWWARSLDYIGFLGFWACLFLLGQASAALPQDALRSIRSRGVVAMVAATATLASIAITLRAFPSFTPVQDMLRWLVVGAAGVSISLLARSAASVRWLPRLAKVTLGVYMIHFPLIVLLEKVAPARMLPWYAWIPLIVLIVVAVSAAVSLALSRTRLRFVVC